METKNNKEKKVFDLIELAAAIVDIGLKEDKNAVAIINNAPITPYGKGGMHITIPSKYNGKDHIAKVIINKKEEGNK